MLIDFNETKEITIPGMNGGSGTMSARMFMDVVIVFVCDFKKI